MSTPTKKYIHSHIHIYKQNLNEQEKIIPESTRNCVKIDRIKDTFSCVESRYKS